MKIDFSFVLVDLMTKELLSDGGKPATLGSIGVNALMAQTPDDKDQSGEEKVKSYVLGSRIIDGGEVEVTPEEASLLKKRIGKLYGPLIVGQCWPILDGTVKPKISAINEAARETANS